MSDPTDGDEAAFAALDHAIDTALGPWKATGPPLVVLFSGGVDSGLLAWELRNRRPLTLFSVGIAGAPDLAAGAAAAGALGIPWQGSTVSPTDLDRTAVALREELGGRPPGLRGLHLALAVAIERAPEGVILCGQGIDELFLGYAHFQEVPVQVAADRAGSDLRRLLEEDWPATVRTAARLGRRIEAPYLHPSFLGAALSLPIARRLPVPVPKGIWRRWTRHRGLPAEIAERPKRAMQYGTGIDRWYRSYVRRG
jgi:asparagine synthase (glutamine-hydrolysing)